MPNSQPDPNTPLSDDERRELERLRAETAGRGATTGQPARSGRARRWGRTLGAVVLIVLGCALAPVSVVSVWANSMVEDTDRYVDTVAPMAEDPAVQQAITDNITREIFKYIDVKGITTQALDALSERGGLPPNVADQLRSLAGPISSGVENFTEGQVSSVVHSDTFTQAWETANRAAHEQLVAALTGENSGGAVTVDNSTVSVNLAPLIDIVKQRLVDRGLNIAARIPAVNTSFVIYQSDDIRKVQNGVDLLNKLGNWMPFIVLALLGLGVFIARDHRLAFIGAGLGVALAALIVAIALQIARSVYLDSIPTDVLPADAAAVLYDNLVRFLREAVRAGILLGLVVAAGAFLTGPSVTARAIRRVLAAGIAWPRRGLDRLGWRMEGLTHWVAAHATLLRAIAVAIAFLILILVHYKTPALVAWLTVGVLGAMLLIQFFATSTTRREGTDALVPGH